MSEREARCASCDEALEMNGHQEGYSGDINSSRTENSKCLIKPKAPKGATVEHFNNGVTRKWETLFIINEKHGYTHGEEMGSANTKGDAIKKAKELAVKHNCTMAITIEKRLVGRGREIADVKPKKSVMGKWKFWGVAAC
jgi:hypothetical protein